MSDTKYEILQDGQAYKVQITRLGHFIQEVEGFSSRADAEAWIARAFRLEAVKGGQQKAIYSPTFGWFNLVSE